MGHTESLHTTASTTLTLLKKHKCFGGWVEFYSHSSISTQTNMRFSVYRPSQQERQKVPVLYWLSGLTCTEENFITKAQVQSWAEKWGFMIVACDTSPRGTQLPGEHESYDFGSGAGHYLNATTPGYRDHYRMDDYVTQELPRLIEKHFNIDPSRMGIFGHSMGGHGALVLGLRNPTLFKSISAFSPICAPMQCDWGKKAFRGYLGDIGENEQRWREYDASAILESLPQDRIIPSILIDQGTEDEFLKEQLRTDLLMEVIKEKKLPVEVRFQEGYDHSYYFISTFIGDHLEFHARQLGVETS